MTLRSTPIQFSPKYLIIHNSGFVLLQYEKFRYM